MSIKSKFVTFEVAQAPTEKAPVGLKVTYMAAINSTVASVSAREYVLILTDANVRTGQQGVWRKCPKCAQRKRQTTAGFCGR